MSPILVRPVREQLEHDRVIRLLQAKYKRKFDVAINPGNAQFAPVGGPAAPWFPDLVLHTTDKNRKVVGIVEVETVESVNHLEAMAEWLPFSRLKTAFHLYVPVSMVDVARRFCADFQVNATEIWAYSAIGEQIRFTLVQKVPGGDATSLVIHGKARPSAPAAKAAPKTPKPAKAAKPATKPSAKPKPAGKTAGKNAGKAGGSIGSAKSATAKASMKASAKGPSKGAGKPSKASSTRATAGRSASKTAKPSAKSSGIRKAAGKVARRK